ncbi:MAG: transcriptional regulator BetI [Hyphomicrobiaceae bacterium]
MELKDSSPPRQARTEAKAVRRRQLIEATIDSIAKHGFAGTTTATVAEGAKLSHGIINFHFKSKNLLFAETIKHLADEHRAQWRETIEKSGSSPGDKLLALVESDFHPKICNRRKIAVWFAFYCEPRYRAIYRERCSDVDAERVTETERLCQEIKQDGGYAQVAPRVFAQSLEAFIDGLWLNILLYPKRFSRQQAKADCHAYLAATFPNHFTATLPACEPR